MNTFGNLFTLTSFGESHGRAIGGVVDGMPAGIPVDMEYIPVSYTHLDVYKRQGYTRSYVSVLGLYM